MCEALIPAPPAATAVAAHTFGCPAEKVSLQRVTTRSLSWFDGSGCGKRGAFTCWNEYNAGKSALHCGPVPASGKTTALRKASEVMKCDIDKVTIDYDPPLDPNVDIDASPDVPDSVKRHWRLAGQFQAQGCGKNVPIKCTILDDQPVATCL
jgi:hypothetical protein